jgi:hypothetical protein
MDMLRIARCTNCLPASLGPKQVVALSYSYAAPTFEACLLSPSVERRAVLLAGTICRVNLGGLTRTVHRPSVLQLRAGIDVSKIEAQFECSVFQVSCRSCVYCQNTDWPRNASNPNAHSSVPRQKAFACVRLCGAGCLILTLQTCIHAGPRLVKPRKGSRGDLDQDRGVHRREKEHGHLLRRLHGAFPASRARAHSFPISLPSAIIWPCVSPTLPGCRV